MNKEHRAFIEQYLAGYPQLTPAQRARLEDEIRIQRILLRRTVARLREVETAPYVETKAQAIQSGLYGLPSIDVTMGGARQYRQRHTTKLTRRRERDKLVSDIIAYTGEIARLENLRMYLRGPVGELGSDPDAMALALRLVEL